MSVERNLRPKVQWLQRELALTASDLRALVEKNPGFLVRIITEERHLGAVGFFPRGGGVRPCHWSGLREAFCTCRDDSA
jgi:hypothetical protein